MRRWFLALVIAMLCLAAYAPLRAQTADRATAPAPAPTPAPTESDNPWAFEEDEAPVETWQQLLANQAVDIGLFTAFAALALTSFFRKSVRLKYVTLVAAVGYLGIYKSQ